MSDAHEEIEAKLVVPDETELAHIDEALSALGLRVTGSETRTLTDTYLDTEDWFLFRAGLACRLRAKPGKASARLAIKTISPIRDGVAARQEWEEDVPLPERPPTALPGQRIARWLGPALGDRPLLPRVAVEQTRRAIDATDAHGTRLEVCADAVRYFAGDDLEQEAIVELELVEGEAARVGKLAKKLARRQDWRPETQSKFQRALAVAGLRPPTPVAAARTEVRRDQRAGKALRRILSAQYRVMRFNEPGTRVGVDAEYLHDMRVAIRRQLAALDVFRDALPRDARRALRDRLKAAAGALGAVRDLDVYLADLPAYAATLENGEHLLAPLRAHLHAEREDAREAMLAFLDGAEWIATCEAIEHTLVALRRPRTAFAQARLPAVAPDLVRARLRAVIDGGRAIRPKSSPATYHDLRKLCKKLRYTAEFLRPLAPDAFGALVRQQKTLQDLLGRHQDADVSMHLLGNFASAHALKKRQRRAIETLRAAQGEAAAAERARFPEVFGAFDAAGWPEALDAALPAS
jgi:triphosphatase